MKKWSALCLLCLAPVVLATGCGSSKKKSSGGNTQSQPAQAPAPGGKTVQVNMKNIQFVPKDIKVPKGGTVKWTNTDTPPHTVTYQSGPSQKFNSGTITPGGTFEQKFDKPGKVNYICTIHPGQSGTITVQ